jgi:hypothetical protein
MSDSCIHIQCDNGQITLISTNDPKIKITLSDAEESNYNGIMKMKCDNELAKYPIKYEIVTKEIMDNYILSLEGYNIPSSIRTSV